MTLTLYLTERKILIHGLKMMILEGICTDQEILEKYVDLSDSDLSQAEKKVCIKSF